MRHYYGHATAAVFAPLEPTSRPGLVARRINDAIALGLLPHGSQLPGEMDLASMLGVSTVTVREALATLRGEGLVETRRGRGGGSFVRLPSGGADELSRRRLQRLSLVELRDLGDLYATVSGGAAGLAARRGSSDEKAQLRRGARELAGADGPEEVRRADARLRVLVTVAAQSPRLYRAEVALQAEVGTLLWLTLTDDGVRRREAGLVDELVGAIEQGDATRARDTAEARVRATTADLLDLRIRTEDR